MAESGGKYGAANLPISPWGWSTPGHQRWSHRKDRKWQQQPGVGQGMVARRHKQRHNTLSQVPLQGLKKFCLLYSMSPASRMRFESLFKRHVIASDSLYYHNSSKLIGFRFMEKYANAEGATHIPHCGYKSSSQRIPLIEFDY